MTPLAYCTNVHAIEHPAEALAALGRFCEPVRIALGRDQLDVGLWLSRLAATELGQDDGPDRLVGALARHRLRCSTFNGFPYGDFHAASVKAAVYRPDWADADRARYTLDLARILARVLPEGVTEGTISTLPLGDAARFDAARVARAAEALVGLAVALDRLAQATGRAIRVCLEPEPECAIQTTDEAIAFFHDDLVRTATRLGVSREVVDRHLGLCFDACHQAVELEDSADSWQRIRDAGVPIGKLQISCALAVDDATPAEAREVLAPFDEPRFLHQVRRRRTGGEIDRWRDLAPAFAATASDADRADWRVHFHVPIHWAPESGAIGTTAPDLARLLALVAAEGVAAERAAAGGVAAERTAPHLEVETYTWGVLPERLRPTDDATLVEGLARELRFAARAFAATP